MIDVAGHVEAIVKELVESRGLELVYVQYEPRTSPAVLRIYIDKPGGVNISDCSEVSRQVGVLLDVEDVIPTQYTLEVSSPGIERPLFKKTDYIRFTGEEIKLLLTEKVENRRNFIGTIEGFSNGVLTLDCAGQLYRIPHELIKRANLVYRFSQNASKPKRR